MENAKVTEPGEAPTIKLPPGIHLPPGELAVYSSGSSILLIPNDSPWANFFRACGEFSEDFMAVREDRPHQDRRSILE